MRFFVFVIWAVSAGIFAGLAVTDSSHNVGLDTGIAVSVTLCALFIAINEDAA
jgi:hypothetical protein